MIMYEFVVACYIDVKNVDRLKEFCEQHNFKFESDNYTNHSEQPEWQNYYRELTGFTGIVERYYVSNKTTNRNGLNDVLNAIEKADFDALITCEIS